MDKQEALDWLNATADDLADDLRRLRALRNQVESDGVPPRSALDSLETMAHNLELDVMMFKRRLPSN
jgi:hypothetical protein